MNSKDFDHKKVPGCFRVQQPKCPFVAVIPTLTVEDITGVKGLADCLVHVSNINTTIYIDDQHRYITTYAGPVFADDYDFASNPLKLRGQVCYDFKNDLAAIYDMSGHFKMFNLANLDSEV